MRSPSPESCRRRPRPHECDDPPVHRSGSDDATVQPGYGPATLGAVLPGVAATLGAPTGLPALDLPAADRVCVVLIDGLGQQLLAENAADAPFLATTDRLDAEGRLPEHHGDVDGLVRHRAAPRATRARRLPGDGPGPRRAAERVEVGSGRRPAPVAAVPDGLPAPDRRPASAAPRSAIPSSAVRGSPKRRCAVRVSSASTSCTTGWMPRWQTLREPGLAYLYWGQVDAAGHLLRRTQPELARALREIDEAIKRLARLLPTGTLLLVTADHGMVDVPHESPGGSGRAARSAVGDRDTRRGGAFRAGLLFAGRRPRVWPHALGRIRRPGLGADPRRRRSPKAGSGLSTSASSGGSAMSSSRASRRSPSSTPERRQQHELKLIGQHGSLTDDEQLVPLLQIVV